MTSEQQFETVLAAVADVQVAVDATALDIERVIEILAWTDTDSPQPPPWVKGGFDGAAGGAEEDIPRTDPPPARGSVGAAAGLLVIAACAPLLVLLWLVGN